MTKGLQENGEAGHVAFDTTSVNTQLLCSFKLKHPK